MGKILNFFCFFIFGFLYLSNLHANNFAYLIVDGKSGKVMESHRSDELRSPASLTKKMTLYLIFEAIKSGKITLKTRFSVSKRAAKQEPCNLWLKIGETISVKDIISSLVTRSANDMAVTAAEGLAGTVENFSALMNQKAKELGMTRTKFYNPTGLPDRRQVSTAKDMMLLARALHKNFPKEYGYFKMKTFYFNGKPVRNHNRMLNSFTGCDGIKTGFTFASRFNISVSAQRIAASGQPIRVFAVVLGGQTSVSRDNKTASLMEKAFKKLHATPKMQEAFVSETSANTEDTLNKIIDESCIEAPEEIAKEEPVKASFKTKKRKAAKKQTPKVATQAMVNQITAHLKKDPIDDILNTPSVKIDINKNLPAGWVKDKIA